MEKDMLIDAVRDFLDDAGYRYEYDIERNILHLGFNVKNKLKTVTVICDFNIAERFLVYTISPIEADPDDLGELLRFVAMANYGLYCGNFELDCRDGEVRYKTCVNVDGLANVSKDIIETSLMMGVSMMERYGNGIAALALGFSDAETEIKKAEAKSEDNPAS